MNEVTASVLVDDHLPLEIVDVDGIAVTFYWPYRSDADTLTISADGCHLAVIEGLDSSRPCVHPNQAWEAWLGCAQRSERLVANAKRQWVHRGEIVGDMTGPKTVKPLPPLPARGAPYASVNETIT